MAAAAASRRRDPNTLSNYEHFTTTHTRIQLAIDFAAQTLACNVKLSLRSTNDSGQQEIILDTSYLSILDVSLNDQPCEWQLAPRTEPFGSPLVIKLGQAIKDGNSVDVDIKLQTTDKCTALGWMSPAQARSKHPYMNSQCQAIHARSIFPCQDTPDVKSTYEFVVDSQMPVIASGLLRSTEKLDNELRRHTYFQEIPIPSYLVAIASGAIVQAPIGPRSRIATSPESLNAAKWEFEKDTENYIQQLEKIIEKPYQWKEYNLLVLPPSFPYGGMENPVYTYVTPTVVSGDRENVDVVAHELSHSYSGNLVTAATWQDFWLNEGWTTYLERRLQAAIFGEPFRDFSAIIGWKGLKDSVAEYGEDKRDYTKLVPDLSGQDPDDFFSQVPYEKGYTFLSHLETLVGKEKWNKYIPHYFTTFARRSLDSLEFKENLINFFAADESASSALKTVDWDAWYYGTGLPPKPDFDTSLADVCHALAAKWENASTNHFQPTSEDVKGWKGRQLVVFLDSVNDFSKPLSKELAQSMGDTYGFFESKNVEVTARYYRVGLRSMDEKVYQPTMELLSNVGRMKFVRPLYRGLNKADQSLALETFERNKDFYHPICRSQVAKDLSVNTS